MDLDPARRDARLAVLRRDPARLEALKRGMARFLGGVLSLRDAGVRESRDGYSGEPTNVVEPTLSSRELAKRPSLAKMFLDLGGYLPTVQMLRDQHETEQLLQRIDATRRMEHQMTNSTPDGMVVLLAPFVKWASFQRAFSMPRGANQPEASIGGMRHRLVDHVGAEIEEWLGAVARKLAADLPDAIVKSFCWGPWAGGMVDSSLAGHFAARGISLIGLEDGARIFADQILQGDRSEVELLIGDDWAG